MSPRRDAGGYQMSHDELLEKIIGMSKKYAEWIPNLDVILTDKTKALRKVVELHKPIHHIYPNGNEFTECSHCNDGCWGCQEWGCIDCDCKCHQAGNKYPCPTIQAIESHLA